MNADDYSRTLIYGTSIGALICGLSGFLIGYIKGIMTKIEILTFHNTETKNKQKNYIINIILLSIVVILILISL